MARPRLERRRRKNGARTRQRQHQLSQRRMVAEPLATHSEGVATVPLYRYDHDASRQRFIVCHRMEISTAGVWQYITLKHRQRRASIATTPRHMSTMLSNLASVDDIAPSRVAKISRLHARHGRGRCLACTHAATPCRAARRRSDGTPPTYRDTHHTTLLPRAAGGIPLHSHRHRRIYLLVGCHSLPA